MMTMDGRRVRHCWGFDDGSLPAGGLVETVLSFEHGRLAGERVRLMRDGSGRYWSVSPRRSYRAEDGSDGSVPGDVVLEAYPIGPKHPGPRWGRVSEARCHTADPSHPWNAGAERPGFETCGHCGWPTWIEFHGNADGMCERCRYSG